MVLVSFIHSVMLALQVIHAAALHSTISEAVVDFTGRVGQLSTSSKHGRSGKSGSAMPSPTQSHTQTVETRRRRQPTSKAILDVVFGGDQNHDQLSVDQYADYPEMARVWHPELVHSERCNSTGCYGCAGRAQCTTVTIGTSYILKPKAG